MAVSNYYFSKYLVTMPYRLPWENLNKSNYIKLSLLYANFYQNRQIGFWGIWKKKFFINFNTLYLQSEALNHKGSWILFLQVLSPIFPIQTWDTSYIFLIIKITETGDLGDTAPNTSSLINFLNISRVWFKLYYFFLFISYRVNPRRT